MSSSYIIEPKSSGCEKKDDTLIIIVNDDGTISVDQETLQSLIMNQSNANVSVVRVDQAGTDAEKGDITLIVDPPPFTSAPINPGGTSTDASTLVDPFMEMDPEQLERLETALQSEEAKQILGENVTAMLDMLTVEEQQNSIRYNIKLDHCYTSRLSPSDPKPRDPLPIIDSPTSDDSLQYSSQLSSPPPLSETSSVADGDGTGATKQRCLAKTGKPVGRPRKNTSLITTSTCNNSRSPINITSTPKSISHTFPRNLSNVTQQHTIVKHQGKSNDEDEDELPSSSSESSESEPPSDNDSDFGPRGPKRGGIRARGGRRGLNTRGGNMTATRRRGSNKHMDIEQVRRLDMEMAAAVNAMKSPEKDDKSGYGLIKGKRPFKTSLARKKDEAQHTESPTVTNEDVSTNVDKPLQTTNQVKANLINANMIKGDMILTKPGQGRTNQKVTFVQKQVLMKPDDMKNIDLKKQVILPKKKLLTQSGAKFFATKDGKLVRIPITTKAITPNVSVAQIKGAGSDVIPTSQSTIVIQNQESILQQSQEPEKVTSPTALSKIKPCDPKKEKRKGDKVDTVIKIETESVRNVENKVVDGTKKHPKKESRKSPYMIDTLGPALFSTPDIIRRVDSNGDSKIQENVVTSMLSTTPSTLVAMSDTVDSLPQLTQSSPSTITPSPNRSDTDSHAAIEKQETSEPLAPSTGSSEKSNVSGEVQPALNSGVIEGEEHLLATLEMEASKHEEELLAEALLLQEELGVDLTENAAIVEQAGSVAAGSLSTNNVLIPSLITSEQETGKSTVTAVATVVSGTVSGVTTIATTTNTVANASKEISKKPLRQDKEPIQIIRGGRIITLPPIEAPATRSKRLQSRTESTKLLQTLTVPTMQQRTTQFIKHDGHPSLDWDESNERNIEADEDDGINENVDNNDESAEISDKKSGKQMEEGADGLNEDEEEGDEDEQDNSDSEDDPNRLWCICKRPHNNRFMICCDMCEDWFHGKCVHVSKAMGQQMEERGIEWVCPNCLKKKGEEMKAKNISARSKVQPEVTSENTRSISSPAQLSIAAETLPSIQSEDDYTTVQYSSGMQCVVCKKEARNSSIYCSDACILAHAQETLTKDKPVTDTTCSSKMTKTSPLDSVAKAKPDARVIVFERKTGRVLTGSDAPTRANLRTWLNQHPTFEVVGANNLGALQIGKTITTFQVQIPGKTGNAALMTTAKGQSLPKMVCSKVSGSKSMILTTGNNKFTVISDDQQQWQQQNQPSTTKSLQLKQTLLPNTNKYPTTLKITTAKTIPSQLQPKQTSVQSPKQPQNVKRQEIKQAVVQAKQQRVKTSPPQKTEPEPIRLNIRKTLAELLSSRIKETEDLRLTDAEINDLAYNIELELYKYFKDTGAKYKAKYRSLVFNIKDTKNLTLFRKIADRSLTPDAVVRLSPDEMASQELAEWREKETKHQLEMIKKNELDLMAQAKSIVVKTHKGEQIIENDGGIDHVDPKTPVQDIVTALNNSDGVTSGAERDLERMNDDERLQVRDDDRKSKDLNDKRRKDKEREKDRGKEKEREREKDGNARSKGDGRGRSPGRSRHKHARDDKDHSKTKGKSKERKSRAKEGKREKEKERDKEKDRDRNRERERSRTRDKEKSKSRERSSREKTKPKEKDRDRERRRSSESSSRNRSSGIVHYQPKDVEKREEEQKREAEKKDDSCMGSTTEKSIEDRLWRHIEDEATTNIIDGNDSDVSDREPTSTVTIKTPDINEEADREREQEPIPMDRDSPKGGLQTVWRGFVNMVDVAKFFITAQEVSGHAKDLMSDLPDTVDVVGRISHETVWDYISKMKKTGSKEILVIRLTAANDEEKIPYITLYSYLNSRSRLGVVGNVSKNIKDFYIMPFSSQSTIPQVLLPLNGPGFEEPRPHLLLGIIVRNKRKRIAGMSSSAVPMKLSKKETDRSYTPPLVGSSKDKLSNISPLMLATTVTSIVTPTNATFSPSSSTLTTSQKTMATLSTVESAKEKQHSVMQTTLDSLNRAHIGMTRGMSLDTATICKIVPELSSKIDLTSSPSKATIDDDGDEPYSPGQMDEEKTDNEIRASSSSTAISAGSMSASMDMDDTSISNSVISARKNSNDLQRRMEELNRQIEEQKQQIQSISSSFLGESTPTLPGLGLDPPTGDVSEESYSPSDTRSFTPPPPSRISKFTQPILEKVSNITIPPNLQEILANVKRQESTKIDPYLPSKPSATFLTTVNSSICQNSEKYSSPPSAKLPTSTFNKPNAEKTSLDVASNNREGVSKGKESKSTLSLLSDLDLIRKAEEELADAATSGTSMNENFVPTSLSATTVLPNIMGVSSSPLMPSSPGLPGLSSTIDMSPLEGIPYKTTFPEPFKRNIAPEQPKPPGLEDEDFPPFPSTPPNVESALSSRSKFTPKSGIVLSMKRKANDESSATCGANKTPRVKSRWGQGPSDSFE